MGTVRLEVVNTGSMDILDIANEVSARYALCDLVNRQEVEVMCYSFLIKRVMTDENKKRIISSPIECAFENNMYGIYWNLDLSKYISEIKQKRNYTLLYNCFLRNS